MIWTFVQNHNPDSMTTLGKRWQTVVPLADSWRWVNNVGPTLGQHQHVLDEIWKATFLVYWRYNVGPTLGQHNNCAALPKLFVFGWSNNIGPTSFFFARKKGFVSLAEQLRANVGSTSRFTYIKSFNSLVYQHWTNVGPTLLFFVNAHVFF